MSEISRPQKPENLAVVILAAGLGKRMNSDLPKVLHEWPKYALDSRQCSARQ